MSRTGLKAFLAALALATAGAVALVGGCSSGDGGGAGPVAAGGTIIGRTIDAASGLGLGGVEVSIVTASGVRTAVSTTPNGDFIIRGVPAGTYTSLLVTPNPTLYGPPRTIAVTIVMAPNGSVTLSGPILILDEFPPNPI